MSTVVAYFGVAPGHTAGHHPSINWWLPYSKVNDTEVDGGFLPAVARHGYAALHHIWVGQEATTILAAHDYSGDNRKGSHCTFAAKGHMGHDNLLELARAQHPRLLRRIEAMGPLFVYVTHSSERGAGV